MNFKIKTIGLIATLLVSIMIILILVFFETGIDKKFLLVLLFATLIFLASFVWQIFRKRKSTKPESILQLPNSRINENPHIIFNKSIELIIKQLKSIRPNFRFALYIIEPQNNNFILQDSSAIEFSESLNLNNEIINKIFDEKQSLLFKTDEYPDSWTDFFSESEMMDNQCLLGSEVRYNNSAIGGLFALVDDARRIDSNDQIIISQVANQIELSLAIIDNIESLQKHVAVQEKIYSILNQANISAGKAAIYGKITEICRSIFKYDKLSIIISNADSKHARVEHVDGYSLDISRDEIFSLTNSIFAKVIIENQIINSKDINLEFRKQHRFFEEERTKRSLLAVLAVPINISDSINGCIAIERFEQKKYSEISRDYFQKIALSLEVLLRWQTDYNEMYLNTTHDNLTALLNYHSFLRRIDVEINRAIRSDQSLVVIIVDVDKFKTINDTHGHQVGNIILKKIAAIIYESVRTIDIVARYGGDEFIIAVSNANILKAEQIANRIVNSVAQNNFKFEGQNIKLTVSIGMVEFPTHTDQVQSLIEYADKAMYSAKKIGGNTFKSHNENS